MEPGLACGLRIGSSLCTRRSLFFDAKNFRGIHLTPQLSKAAERFIGSLFLSFFRTTGSYGSNQFAYTPGHGARDALALYVLSWLRALSSQYKIAVYLSDVSGAFDRVPTHRLLLKLNASGMHPLFCSLIESWLQRRTAKVALDGCFSKEIVLSNQVFQGTVWGPPLWNVFYADARTAVAANGFC